MAVRIRKYGWDRAGRLFEFEIGNLIDQEIDKTFDQVEEIYRNSVIDLIFAQPGHWVDKSESWASRSTDMLYIGKTGSFLGLLQDRKIRRGIRAKSGDKRIFIGARHDIRHPASGLTMEKIAGILQNTPEPNARDLFTLAYEKVEDQINRVFRNFNIIIK